MDLRTATSHTPTRRLFSLRQAPAGSSRGPGHGCRLPPRLLSLVLLLSISRRHGGSWAAAATPVLSSDALPWRSGKGEKAFDPAARYLYYERNSNDFMAGIRHRTWSYGCMLGEALRLRRIFVLDTEIGVVAQHNKGRTEVRKFEQFFDLWYMRKHFPIITMPAFLKGWERYGGQNGTEVSVCHYPIGGGPPFEEVQECNATIVYRHYEKDRQYGFVTCSINKQIKRPSRGFAISPSLTKIAKEILKDLRGNFMAIHVRRGDKLKFPARWPNLDRDTSPPHILEVLKQRNVSSETAIYIASDEEKEDFFDPLLSYYPHTKTLNSYKHLWAPGSDWWKFNSGFSRRPEFDGLMSGVVDYEVLRRAALKLDTFNDLTEGPR